MFKSGGIAIKNNKYASDRIQWPPLDWMLGAAFFLLLFTHFGFYHWLISAGLLFTVLWVRPDTEFIPWYLISTLCFVLNAYKNLLVRGQESLPFLGLWPSAGQFVLGTLLAPIAIYVAVQYLKKNAIRIDNANSFVGLSTLLKAALLAAALLTIKDLAFVLNAGEISEVRAGRIINTELISWHDGYGVLGNFLISHFMGAYVGIILVAPLAMWSLVAEFRLQSWQIMKHAFIYLLPLVMLLGVGLKMGHEAQFLGLLEIVLLASVAVLAFVHGWRGAVISILLISIMVSVDNHLDGVMHDPKEMQLLIAIVGSLALLFGISVDELKFKEKKLLLKKDELFAAAVQKQELFSRLVEASRRSMYAQDTERQRIANELHDDVGQSLTALKIHLNLLQHDLHQTGHAVNATRLMDISQNISEGIRRVVLDLAPMELNELGLYMALAHGALQKMATQAGLCYQINFKGRVEDLDRLDASSQLAAYRIVQEALTNTIKHAHASRCDIRLNIGRRQGALLLFICVQDDGVGLLDSVYAPFFSTIRDRALALHGSVHVRSQFGLRLHVMLRQQTVS